MNLDDIWDGAQKVCRVSVTPRAKNTKHARTRWLAMYVARQRGFSLGEIAKFFGQHHTTVMYAVSEMEKRGRVPELDALEKVLTAPPPQPKSEERVRERLPNDRQGVTLHFVIITRKADGEGTEDIDGYLQTGEFEGGGRLGEIFLKVGKHGDHHALLDMWCQSTSIALQYGAPVEDLLGRFVNTRFEPSGAVSGVTGIMRCSSPLDLVCKFLLLKYGMKEVAA